MNKRDRSPEAEAKRARHVTMDFTGSGGLARAQISHDMYVPPEPKPKRGWAAKRRREPFKDYFEPEKMAKARARHVHPRHKRKAHG